MHTLLLETKIIKYLSRAILLSFVAFVGFNFVSTRNLPRESTFLITDAAERGNGSGVLVAEHTLLTARHVAEAARFRPLFVHDKQGHKYFLSVKSIDPNADLALMTFVEDIDAPVARVGSLPPIDASVVAVGYPVHRMVGAQIQTEGQIQSTGRESDGFPSQRVVSTANVAPGNSGGGLFHRNWLGKYELVGIVVSGPVIPFGFTAQFLTYVPNSVPSDYIKLFLAVNGV